MRVERDQVLTLVALLALFGVAGAAAWLPQHQRQQRLESQILVAQRQLGLDRASCQGLPALAKEVIQLQQVAGAARKLVPQEAELADFLRQVSTELAAVQVSNQEVMTRPIVAGAEYNVIPLALKFRGSSTAVCEFLRRVEALRRLVRTTRVELETVPGQSGLLARVELCTFFAPPEAKQP